MDTNSVMNSLIKVPFHEGEILCVKNEDGEHVVLKPLCQQLAIDVQAQQRRTQRAAWGKAWTAMMAVQLPGRVREAVRPYLEQGGHA